MVKLLVDRAADIAPETAGRYGIEVLPFVVNLDGESIIVDKDYPADRFYSLLRASGSIPTTSQMSPEELENIFRRMGKENPIIYVSISAKGSGINSMAGLIAESLGDEGYDITVIDSGMYAYAIGFPVVEAAELAERGAGKDEIISFLIQAFERDTAYFIVDDLTYLKKGGRIKATTMAVSNLLDIKPILMITDGLVEAYKKVRGLKKAMSVLVGYIEERMEDPENNEVVILDADAQDKAAAIEPLIRKRVNPGSVSYSHIGPVVTAHTGPGLIGVYFKHKKPYTEYGK